MSNQFEQLKEAPLDEQSKEMIRVQEEELEKLKKIADLMKHPGGEELLAMLKKDFEYYLRKTIVDNDPDQIANLRAYTRLMDKLTTGEQMDAIYAWVEEKINSIK